MAEMTAGEPVTAWLSPAASVRAIWVPQAGRVRLTIVDGAAALALVLSDAQATQTCRQLVDSRPWVPWWEVYDR